MVNLTTLAPDIVAAILDDTLTPDLTLFDLAVDPPALWEDAAFAYSSVPTRAMRNWHRMRSARRR